MSTTVLEKHFKRMGARVQVADMERQPWQQRPPSGVTLDVSRDKVGEYFFIRKSKDTDVDVLNVAPKDRHLLLMTRVPDERGRPVKAKFLLGHDERHWFVAAIPESSGATTVESARQALKPERVAGKEIGLKARDRHKRHNKAWLRQGEWFFVPVPSAKVNPLLILKSEPITRGRGKPHMCQELYREGGELVYVGGSEQLTQAQFNALDEKARRGHAWRSMIRNPKVLVRGRITHGDHATVILDGWHEVCMNTEHLSFAMSQVTFLD